MQIILVLPDFVQPLLEYVNNAKVILNAIQPSPIAMMEYVSNATNLIYLAMMGYFAIQEFV
jgi:hypothetical protein